jgi:hypothetical protein
MFKKLGLTCLLTISCAQAGDNFGSSFAGSMTGSMVGGLLTTAATRSGDGGYREGRGSRRAVKDLQEAMDDLQNKVSKDLRTMANKIDDLTQLCIKLRNRIKTLEAREKHQNDKDAIEE